VLNESIGINLKITILFTITEFLTPILSKYVTKDYIDKLFLLIGLIPTEEFEHEVNYVQSKKAKGTKWQKKAKPLQLVNSGNL